MSILDNASSPVVALNSFSADGANSTSFLAASLIPDSQLPAPFKKCTLWTHQSLFERDSFAEWTLFVALPCVWILLVVAGSTILKKSKLGVLSTYTSVEELNKQQPGYPILDFIRVLAILWVMMNHAGSEGRVDILDRLPSAEAFKRAVHTHWLLGALLGNSALGVEVFLVLSGLLSAQTWQRQADQDFWPHYTRYVFARVTRLAPSVCVFILVASGPAMRWILPRFAETMVSACGAKGLLAHMFFVGNWQEIPTCLGYLWYVGLDMQLHMVAPAFMWLLNKGRVFATLSLLSIVAVSIVLRGAYCLTYETCNKSDVDIPFISYPGVDPASVKHIYLGLWEMYARPYTKCGPFLIGLLFGWATTKFTGAEWKIARRTATVLFVGGVTVAVATVYGILPEYWWPDMSANTYNVTYTATFRTVFSLALIAIISSYTQEAEPTKVSQWWTFFARLTFSAYLIHMPVVYGLNFIDAFQTTERAESLLVALLYVAVVSFVLAFFFYILVEAPLARLISAVNRYRMSPPSIPKVDEKDENDGKDGKKEADGNGNVHLLPSMKKKSE